MVQVRPVRVRLVQVFFFLESYWSGTSQTSWAHTGTSQKSRSHTLQVRTVGWNGTSLTSGSQTGTSYGRQRGRVVRLLDFESVGRGLESHPTHFTDLFHGSPEILNPSVALVNS